MDSTVTARMSVQKKEQGAKVLASLGTTPSRAINDLYDYAIEHKALPFADATIGQSSQTLEERLADATLWIDGITALPPNNHFSSMTDEEIKRERLQARGLM